MSLIDVSTFYIMLKKNSSNTMGVCDNCTVKCSYDEYNSLQPTTPNYGLWSNYVSSPRMGVSSLRHFGQCIKPNQLKEKNDEFFNDNDVFCNQMHLNQVSRTEQFKPSCQFSSNKTTPIGLYHNRDAHYKGDMSSALSGKNESPFSPSPDFDAPGCSTPTNTVDWCRWPVCKMYFQNALHRRQLAGNLQTDSAASMHPFPSMINNTLDAGVLPVVAFPCTLGEFNCPNAHAGPEFSEAISEPDNCVRVCYDSLGVGGRYCRRPPGNCRFFHPPEHIRAYLLQERFLHPKRLLRQHRSSGKLLPLPNSPPFTALTNGNEVRATQLTNHGAFCDAPITYDVQQQHKPTKFMFNDLSSKFTTWGGAPSKLINNPVTGCKVFEDMGLCTTLVPPHSVSFQQSENYSQMLNQDGVSLPGGLTQGYDVQMTRHLPKDAQYEHHQQQKLVKCLLEQLKREDESNKHHRKVQENVYNQVIDNSFGIDKPDGSNTQNFLLANAKSIHKDLNIPWW